MLIYPLLRAVEMSLGAAMRRYSPRSGWLRSTYCIHSGLRAGRCKFSPRPPPVKLKACVGIRRRDAFPRRRRCTRPLLDNEAEPGARTWTSPAEIARPHAEAPSPRVMPGSATSTKQPSPINPRPGAGLLGASMDAPGFARSKLAKFGDRRGCSHLFGLSAYHTL